ncbi:hypothetical protein ACA910_005284 [Epithemia clementina (nom. ined.)]
MLMMTKERVDQILARNPPSPPHQQQHQQHEQQRTLTTTAAATTTTCRNGTLAAVLALPLSPTNQEEEQQASVSPSFKKQPPPASSAASTCTSTRNMASAASSSRLKRRNNNNNNQSAELGDEDDYDELRSSQVDNSNHVVVIQTTEQKLKEAERILSTEIYNLNTVPDHFLTWTLVTSFFHIIQALIMFFIAIGAASDHDWYWYVSYPNPSNADEDSAKQPELKAVASFSILWLVPLVPLVTGIFQLASIVFRESYVYHVERHQNPFRWMEFSVSAPLMKLLVGQLVGITDVQLLLCIVVLMLVAIQSAATHETVNAKARSVDRPQYWRPFWTAWMAHLTNWGILLTYYSVYTRRGGDTSGLVGTVVWSQFVLDCGFPTLFTLQWKKITAFGQDYIAVEKAFFVLGFVAKTGLTWLVIFSVLREDNI